MALTRLARVSLGTFIGGVVACLFPILFTASQTLKMIWKDFEIPLLLLYGVLYNTLMVLAYRNDRVLYQVVVRSGNLGLAFAAGLLLSFSGVSWATFGWYLTVISFFHWSEYFFTATTNPRSLTLESFLLDHSREYELAVVASCTEYFLEWFIYPEMKQITVLSVVGLLLTLGGEALRKISMVTAGISFNHYVQRTKHSDHHLVTSGVYSLFRHPSYVGWFWWSVGTQIMLLNPLCMVGYAVVSWRFFNERIYDEERHLLNFFGEDYINYQRLTPTGLPFIKGFRVPL